MTTSAVTGPLGSFGQAPSLDSNPDLGASFFWAGAGILDPRSQFTYVPGGKNPYYLWQGVQRIQTMYVVPVTKSATLLAAAQHITSGTAMTLASSTTTGVAVGVSIPRQDTGVTVSGLLEIDPLVMSCTANVTAGSNILTVTAMGTGSGNNTLGICPGMVLTDSTHASAIPTGTTITGYVSGAGGIGQYTMSANAALSETGDTVTGLYTAFPHALPFGSSARVNLWNPMAMCTRTLLVTCSAGTGAGGNFVVNGLDVYGFPMTETIVLPASTTTQAGAKAWKYIKSVTPNLTDGSLNYSIGTNDVIGLPIRSDKLQVGSEYDATLMMNNAIITATTGYTAAVKTTASATTGDVRGTYALQTSSDGTLAFAVLQSPLAPNLNSAIGLYGVSQFTAW